MIWRYNVYFLSSQTCMLQLPETYLASLYSYVNRQMFFTEQAVGLKQELEKLEERVVELWIAGIQEMHVYCGGLRKQVWDRSNNVLRSWPFEPPLTFSLKRFRNVMTGHEFLPEIGLVYKYKFHGNHREFVDRNLWSQATKLVESTSETFPTSTCLGKRKPRIPRHGINVQNNCHCLEYAYKIERWDEMFHGGLI